MTTCYVVGVDRTGQNDALRAHGADEPAFVCRVFAQDGYDFAQPAKDGLRHRPPLNWWQAFIPRSGCAPDACGRGPEKVSGGGV